MAKQKTSGEELEILKKAIQNKSLGRLYVLFGEEVFLLEHYLGQMKQQLLDPLTEDFNYHRFNTETFDITAFCEAVENLPMMAEFTLIQVEDIDLFKLIETDRGRIAATLCDIPDYCTVVFRYTVGAWKPDKRQKKLWDAIDKNGLIVEFAKQNQQDLTAWITRHFAARQKKISGDLCGYLIEITDGTMTSLMGEIDKICAYSGADTICRADIDAVVEPVLDAVVFQMTDKMSSGQFDGALVKLQELLKMQQEPVALLGAIGAHYRRIGTARTLLDHRKSAYDLQKLCGIPDYPAKKAMEAARKVSPGFCKTAVTLIMETDYKLKTSGGDSQRLLERLILDLAREARNG